MPAWQAALAGAVRSIDELLDILAIAPDRLPCPPPDKAFPLRVPRGFVDRMVPGNAHDPLLLQVLPVRDEAAVTAGFLADPLQEHGSMPVPGLLHKYQGRALLTVTGACAIHCRYCFRRHFTYAEARPAGDNLQRAIDYLARHPDIHELILSGGDPLSLTDCRLQRLTDSLAGLPQLDTLRIHTRMPIVLPERVDDGLLAWLDKLAFRVVLVTHCNHANEIDDTVHAAMQRLAGAGITLLNQSVLLRGINDDEDTLVRLSRRLFATGILPYYLHQLDRVQGAARFEVSDATARQLLEAVRKRLPGYLVPRLVRELPGAGSKCPL